MTQKRKKLLEQIDEFLNKPFGRLTVDKHENILYVEITDKVKI